jgi:hypothetical protein
MKAMPFSDEQVIKLIETTVATATKVDNLTQRLFGGGFDAGAIAKLYQIGESHNTFATAALEKHACEDEINIKAVNTAVNAVDRKVTWYSGAIAACGAIGTLILGLLTWHAAEVAAKAAVIANTIHTH